MKVVLATLISHFTIFQSWPLSLLRCLVNLNLLYTSPPMMVNSMLKEVYGRSKLIVRLNKRQGQDRSKVPALLSDAPSIKLLTLPRKNVHGELMWPEVKWWKPNQNETNLLSDDWRWRIYKKNRRGRTQSQRSKIFEGEKKNNRVEGNKPYYWGNAYLNLNLKTRVSLKPGEREEKVEEIT